MMKPFRKSTFVILFTFFILGLMDDTNAQTLKLEKYLPKEYRYNIHEEKEEEGTFATSYEAVDPKTQIAPFEIIVTEVPKSLMDLNGTVKGLEENNQNVAPDHQFKLLNKEETNSLSRRLYLFSQRVSKVLILMYQQDDRFTMVEVEFRPDDFKTVSLERWQEIFWQIH